MNGRVSKRLRKKARAIWQEKMDPNLHIVQILKGLKRDYYRGKK